MTLDDKAWRAVKGAYQLEEAKRTGKVSTGSLFDALEAETGGNVTAEALETFMARVQAGNNG